MREARVAHSGILGLRCSDSRLAATRRSHEEGERTVEHAQYIIVGAGPAGLQMAYLMQRRGHDYLVVEANDTAGSFFATQPRHRTLLSLNKRFNGFPEHEFNMRHDWNSLLTEEADPLFREYSAELYPNADDLHRYLVDFADRHRLRIRYNSRIELIERGAGAGFVLNDKTGRRYTCERLLVGTGACAPHLPNDIEGIEMAEGYEDHELDPTHYENKTVLVIGRGNSAFEVANHLAGHAAIIHIAIGNRPIQLAWETHSVRHVRSVNNTVLEMLHVKALHGAVGLNVRKIRRAEDGAFEVVADEEVPNWQEPGMLELQLRYDHVIRCTGFKYVTPEIFSDDVRPRADEQTKYPVLDPSWQSTTPNLFYIGTAMAGRDRQAASSFIHGFRYNVRTLFRMLEHRYHGKELPSSVHRLETVDDLRGLADHLLSRLSTTAALYQQFGFLCDVLQFSAGNCEIFEELPKDYVLEQPRFTENTDIIVMTLEYGFHRYPGANPLSFITQMDEATSRRCAAYLHPVFRHYRNGVFVEEDNIGESLTLRFSKHRTLRPSTSAPQEDVEQNTVMNIINRVSKTAEQVFSEKALLANHAFRPWPKDRPLDAKGLPKCAAAPRAPVDPVE